MQRILLVDDEDTFRASLAEVLADREDRVVYTARDGVEAMEQLDAHATDVVITDLQMPRMSGFELLTHMARQHPQVCVIVVTAFANPQMEQNFRMLRVQHYLEKPIDIAELSDRIDRILAVPSSSRAPKSMRGLVNALTRASSEALDGECIVCHGPESGRIFVVAGRIAWATATTARETLVTRLAAETTLTLEDLRTAFEECKRTQRNFGETLVEWGLIDRTTLRQVLLDHVAYCFAQMAAWPTSDVMFVPERRKYEGGLLFGLGEFLDAALTFDPRAETLLALAQHLRLGEVPQLQVAPSQPNARNGATEDEPISQRRTTGPDSEVQREAPGHHADVTFAGTNPSIGEQAVADMNAILDGLKVIDGFIGAAAFTPDGDVVAQVGGAGVNLAELGALANDVLLKAQKATDMMDVGRGNQIHITAPRANVLVRCLNENTDFAANEPGRAHVHVMLVLEAEANIGLGRMRLEKVVQLLAPVLR